MDTPGNLIAGLFCDRMACLAGISPGESGGICLVFDRC